MHMGTIHPPSERRVARLLATVALCERGAIEEAVEGLIALLDARDGDIDLEDSEAGQTCIDDRGRHLTYRTLAEHRPSDDADAIDGAWVEWESRHPRAQRRALHELMGDGAHEDDEPNGDEADGTWGAEDEFMTHAGSGPGCDLADPGGDAAGKADEAGVVDLLERHRDRIRASRCAVVAGPWGTSYQLRQPLMRRHEVRR
jgi:hypothetical protein